MMAPVRQSGAKPRLYYTPSSYYSMIARLALAEGGVAHERVFVDIHVRMSQQQPDYVRLNPNMTVPTLVLADRVLDQSRDIAAEIPKRPALARYWHAMQARPSFSAADLWTKLHVGHLIGSILGIGRG